MTHLVFSDHARFEMQRRQTVEEAVREVVIPPEQMVPSGKGRTVCQSRVDDPISGKRMLLRVVTEERQDAVSVVTAYQTSRISKYWQPEGEP